MISPPEVHEWMIQSRPGGGNSLDALLFLMLARQARASIEATIFLRERELSYFGVEDWPDNWYAGTRGEEGEFKTITRCVAFEGEIPCLYAVQLVVPVRGSDSFLKQAEPSFLSLVDFVSSTTGAGIGIKLASTLPTLLGAADLKTGRRIRYRLTRVKATSETTSIYWIERMEVGRGRRAGGAGAPVPFLSF